MGHTSFATCLKLPSHLYIPHLRYLEILLSTKMSISRAFRCRWCPSGVPDSTLWDRADPCFCSSASPGKWARWTPPPLTPSHLASLPSQGAHLFLLRPVLDRQASRGHRNLLVFLTSPSSYSSFPADGCDRAASWEQQQPHRAPGGELGRHPQHQE